MNDVWDHVFVLGVTLTLIPSAHGGSPLLDLFRPEVVQTFRVINDVVMGGMSMARLSSTGSN